MLGNSVAYLTQRSPVWAVFSFAMLGKMLGHVVSPKLPGRGFTALHMVARLGGGLQGGEGASRLRRVAGTLLCDALGIACVWRLMLVARWFQALRAAAHAQGALPALRARLSGQGGGGGGGGGGARRDAARHLARVRELEAELQRAHGSSQCEGGGGARPGMLLVGAAAAPGRLGGGEAAAVGVAAEEAARVAAAEAGARAPQKARTT